METVNDMIDNSEDPRELKRALSVKMLQAGIKPQMIANVLNVSEQYVSKWKGKYQQEGASGLRLGYQGSRGYLTKEQKAEVVAWIEGQETSSVEAVRDYVEAEHGVIYRSKQSYYDLMEAGGMSYHRTEAVNPKRDESQIMNKREEIKKKWHSINKK